MPRIGWHSRPAPNTGLLCARRKHMIARTDDSQQWRRASLKLLLAWLAVLALCWETTHTMIEAWARSRTYAHGFLVLPTTGYIVWCYRDRLRGLSPAPHAMGPLLVAWLACAWFIGELTGTGLVQQVAVVAMLPGLVLAVMGTEVLRVLQFPLGFLAFALPVGTSLEPWLQKATALFIMGGLHLAGIPRQRDGFLISIPSGTWEVAPDCSGLRYLLPGLALGYLYTALMHRTVRQRVSFLLLCALLLILANGVRAYGIILGDHLGIAEGTDHRVFSYTIYGVTVGSLGWLGLRWDAGRVRERCADAHP
jgi:exosortase A